MRLVLFILIEMWLAPFLIVAMVLFKIRLRKVIAAGVTASAHKPLDHRLILHTAGKRIDEPTARLAPHLPMYSPFISWAFGSFGLASRLSGYTFAWTTYPPAMPSTLYSFVPHRTHFIDRCFAEATRPGGSVSVGQVVVLGAGWDTRAWGLGADTDVRVFEIDTPLSQDVKQGAVQAAGLSTDRVTFVATDFVEKTWLQALVEAGCDVTVPTLFVLEGLVYYLTDADVQSTLRDIASTAPGSSLVFDYLSMELIRREAPHAEMGATLHDSVSKNYPNEPLLSGISTAAPARTQVASFLAEAGLELTDYEPFGPDDEPFGGVVRAVRPA
jgi:methyltransferase (TIGR00027 family)